MAVDASDADVIINRMNVALARSQKIMNSWLPPKPAEEIEGIAQVHDEDDDNFKAMIEEGGVESTTTYDDPGLPDGAFHRKNLSPNNKLLEQLLGKKVAQQRTKEKDAGKSMSTSKHISPKSMISRPKQQTQDVDSDKEEEGGRAAAFKSRKKASNAIDEDPVERVFGDEMDTLLINRDVPGIPSSPSQDIKSLATHAAPEKSTKRRNMSYLDELLSQKAKKANKKNQKVDIES